MKELRVTGEDVDGAVNRLFLVVLEIRNGESEYIQYRATHAENIDRAWEKARAWINDFWGTQTVPDKDTPYRVWNCEMTESIAIGGVEESTPEQLVRRLEICVEEK